MRIALAVSLVVALTAAAAMAADPFGPAAGPTATKAGVTVNFAEERQKAAAIESDFAAGKYDEVIEAARTFLRTTKDDVAKNDVTRLVAESLRKKSEWKLALAAYLKARDRYDKGADPHVRFGAIADILQVSPNGVYSPLEAAAAAGAAKASAGAGAPATAASSPTAGSDPAAPAAPTAAAPARTLADDGYLAEALALLAGRRVEKLKSKLATLKRARSPQEVVAIQTAINEEFRQARLLAPNLPSEIEQLAAQLAGQRLAEVGRDLIATLTTKQGEFQTAIRLRMLTLAQRKDIESCQNLCTQLATNEGNFQAAVTTVSASGGWTEGGTLQTESTTRQDAYTKLAKGFVAPPSNAADRAMDWGGRGGLGGGGWGGGGGGGGGGGRGF